MAQTPRSSTGSGTTTIQNSTISGNTASDNGGGIYLYAYDGTTATIQQSTISGNTSHNPSSGYGYYSRGGGIYSKNYGTAAIQNSTITGNTADSGGGGIYSYSSDSSYAEVDRPQMKRDHPNANGPRHDEESINGNRNGARPDAPPPPI